jgi:hypothetical protein
VTGERRTMTRIRACVGSGGVRLAYAVVSDDGTNPFGLAAV